MELLSFLYGLFWGGVLTVLLAVFGAYKALCLVDEKDRQPSDPKSIAMGLGAAQEAKLTSQDAEKMFRDALLDKLRSTNSNVLAPVAPPMSPMSEPESLPATVTLNATEEEFNGLSKVAKERQKDIRTMTSLIQELCNAHKNFSKALQKIAKSAESAVKEEGSISVKWWQAISGAIKQLSQLEEKTSDYCRDELGLGLSNLIEHQTLVESKLTTEGLKLIRDLRDCMQHTMNIKRGRDDMVRKVESAKEKINMEPDAKLSQDQRLMKKLSDAESEWQETSQRLKNLEDTFKIRMPRIEHEFELLSINGRMTMQQLLLKFTQQLLASEEQSRGVLFRMRVDLSAATLDTGNPYDSMIEETLRAFEHHDDDKPLIPVLDMGSDAMAAIASALPAALPPFPAALIDAISPETCVWFNALTGRIYRDVARSEHFREWLRSKLHYLLNKGSRPEFIEELLVSNIRFGAAPPLLKNTKWIPVRAEDGCDPNYDVILTSDMVFRGGIGFTVSTKLWFNWPRDKYAYLPIEVDLELSEFSGKLKFGVKKRQTFISFMDEPFSRFTVHSTLGHQYKVPNVPKINEIIVNRIKKAIRNRFVQPRCFQFRLIWPDKWWPPSDSRDVTFEDEDDEARVANGDLQGGGHEGVEAEVTISDTTTARQSDETGVQSPPSDSPPDDQNDPTQTLDETDGELQVEGEEKDASLTALSRIKQIFKKKPDKLEETIAPGLPEMGGGGPTAKRSSMWPAWSLARKMSNGDKDQNDTDNRPFPDNAVFEGAERRNSHIEMLLELAETNDFSDDEIGEDDADDTDETSWNACLHTAQDHFRNTSDVVHGNMPKRKLRRQRPQKFKHRSYRSTVSTPGAIYTSTKAQYPQPRSYNSLANHPSLAHSRRCHSVSDFRHHALYIQVYSDAEIGSSTAVSALYHHYDRSRSAGAACIDVDLLSTPLSQASSPRALNAAGMVMKANQSMDDSALEVRKPSTMQSLFLKYTGSLQVLSLPSFKPSQRRVFSPNLTTPMYSTPPHQKTSESIENENVCSEAMETPSYVQALKSLVHSHAPSSRSPTHEHQYQPSLLSLSEVIEQPLLTGFLKVQKGLVPIPVRRWCELTGTMLTMYIKEGDAHPWAAFDTHNVTCRPLENNLSFELQFHTSASSNISNGTGSSAADEFFPTAPEPQQTHRRTHSQGRLSPNPNTSARSYMSTPVPQWRNLQTSGPEKLRRLVVTAESESVARKWVVALQHASSPLPVTTQLAPVSPSPP